MERKQVEAAMSGLVLAVGLLGTGGTVAGTAVTLRDLLQTRNIVAMSGTYDHALQQWVTADPEQKMRVAGTSSFDESDN